jgi:hypothetical protein
MGKEYQWWQFDESPYSQLALSLSEDVFGDLQENPPIDIPEPVAPVDFYKPNAPLSLTINEFTPASDATGGAKPFMLRDVAPGYKLGLVSLRTFAYFIEAEAVWDDASKTATITGVDLKGNPLEITMVSDDSKGTVNGQTYDIADYSGSAPSGTCSAYNNGGTIYLPLRFLMNAYGGSLSWDPVTWTATLHKF